MNYRNFAKDTWQIFNKQILGKDVYLFGFNRAKDILREMSQFGPVWNVKGILDNDNQKWGRVCISDYEYEVKSPNILVNNENNVVVLLCGSYCGQMAMQLEQMGIHDYYAEIWMNRSKELEKPHAFVVKDDIKNELKNIMVDDYSKSLIDAICDKREVGFADYSDITSRGSEYFIDEFWKPSINGVFVDGGAYDGDTIEEIYNWTHDQFKHIYSFEPQSDKADIIESNLWKWGGRVSFFRKGLWSESSSISFKNGTSAVSGRISDSGDESIDTVAIDDVVNEKVDFIKMDIEGAELMALHGAQKTIQNYKPNLAICIYHKDDDLWEIPFYIHKLVPEYKLSVRHYGISHNGTVLYARL